MFTDTPFSIAFLIVAAIAAVAAVVWAYARLRNVVRPTWLGGLVGLRLLAFTGLFFLLVNPYRVVEEPDPDDFHVTVLADVSGSMKQRDIRDGELSRMELIERWLNDEEPSPIAALRDRDYSLHTYLFAEEVIPHGSGSLQPLPGGTAIGDALRHTVRDPARMPGAVIVLSDGHSNAGESPMEAARSLQREGIPVTTIGLGSHQPPGEISATFAGARFQGERGSPMRLPITLSNTRGEDAEVQLELHDRDGRIEEKSVSLPAGSEEIEEDFVITPRRAGGEGYRLKMRKNGEIEATDIAAVDVSDPETFRILYLSARPSPELRFIQQATAEAEQISVEAIVRTAPEFFFHDLHRPDEELVPPDDFPSDVSFFNEYDAILIDAPSLGELENLGEVFKEFVARRGGGILLTGRPPEGVSEEYRTLLPLVEWERETPVNSRPLRLEPAPVFSEIAGGSLFEPPRLFLPEEAPATVSREWKLGARTISETLDGDAAVMAAHAYGAGRVAWLGTNQTFQWRLSSETGMRQHELFWNNLLVWLSSNRKPRTDFPVHGQRFPLAADVDLGGSVMGSDFRPAPDANVTARVEDPHGDIQRVRLTPSFRQPGRFEAEWQPRETGEYRVTYDIEFANGERMEEEAFFVVSHDDIERQSTAYREELLRDIARVTGGEFRHYSNARRFDDPPLSDEIPTREHRRYLAGHWLFLLLLVAPLCAEWYFRRKIGLR